MEKESKEFINQELNEFYNSYYGELSIGRIVKFNQDPDIWFGQDHFNKEGFAVIVEKDDEDYAVISLLYGYSAWYETEQLIPATKKEISNLIKQGFKIQRGYLGE